MEQKKNLITIEGIDGCGKSLLAQSLYKLLCDKGLDIVLTKEPGSTNLGQGLRKILHEQKKDVCDLSEYLLFAADRAQHFVQVVMPALNENKIVISDRMADSSLAYQGYGRKLDAKNIKLVNAWAMQNIKPDLVLYVKLDIETALKRISERGEKLTSFEQEEKDFWVRVINGYETIFKTNKNAIELDGTLSEEELCKIAMREIEILRNAS